MSAEIGYSDQGTWATSTAYSVRQLVVGDGSPDAFFYYCVTAHTSSANNEPPDAVWSRVYSKLGDEVTGPYSYEHIRDRLTFSGQTGNPALVLDLRARRREPGTDRRKPKEGGGSRFRVQIRKCLVFVST